MEDLLSALQRITPYGNKDGFDEICYLQMSNIIANKAAGHWDANKRNQFAIFFRLLPQSGVAAYKIRDTLIKNNVSDLTPALIKILETEIDTLIDFESVTDESELTETLDDYVSILTAEELWPVEQSYIEIAASYFNIFFTDLLKLNITARSGRISLFTM